MSTLGKKVIIVGAGLAGLSCAYELGQKGYRVEILEARNRPGGRVETQRDAFSSPLFAEAGAYWINQRHAVTMDYIDKLGLKQTLAKLPVGEDQTHLLFYVRKKRLLAQLNPTDQWPDDLKLTAKEKGMGLGGIMSSMFCSDPAIEDPTAAGWPSPAVIEKYGHMNFQKFLSEPRRILNFKTSELEDYTPSSGAIELMRPWFAWLDDDYTNLSALAMVRDLILVRRFCERPPTPWYTIKTGMDSLPRAFETKVNQLGATIRYNAPVVAMKQNETSVSVTHLLPSGDRQEVTGDYLVSAIPFSTLRNIKDLPRFSDGKRKAIDELQYAAVSRLYIECKRPVKDMEDGAGFVDLPIGNLLDMTFTQGENNRGKIIQTFAIGQQARKIAAMSESERKSFVLEQLGPVFEGRLREDNIERIVPKFWEQDPWALGAYPYFTPEQFLNFSPTDMAKPEGRIYFAGEHTSRYTGFIEGALDSGQRAAEEIRAI